MSDDAKKTKPPYLPFGTFHNFVNGLAEHELPTHIDKSLMSTFSGSVQSLLMAALRSTGFIDPDGAPSERLERYVGETPNQRKTILLEALQDGFPCLFEPDVDLMRITPAQFDRRLRDAYDLSSSTLDKAANFFLTAAPECGLQIGNHLEKRKPASRKTASSKKAKESSTASQTKAREEVGGGGGQTPPSPNPATAVKPLEYQLIDLLKNPEIGQQESDAIWTLVRFLSGKHGDC